jgi:hypothetical protein
MTRPPRPPGPTATDAHGGRDKSPRTTHPGGAAERLLLHDDLATHARGAPPAERVSATTTRATTTRAPTTRATSTPPNLTCT